MGSAPGSADVDNITFNGGSLLTTSNITFNANRGVTMTGAGTINVASSTTSNIQGIIRGSGALTKAGSGTLTLSGTNTYTGNTIINSGTFNVTGTLSDSTAVSIASGATYDVDATDTVTSIEGAGNIDIASSQTLTAGNGDDKTLSGVISGSGNLLKVGSGILTLSGNNSKTGSIGIANGTLSVSSSANLGVTPSSADADNIIFNNNGILKTTSSFTLGSNKGITMTGAGRISTDASTTLTYGGIITDSGALTKIGEGTLILTGENTLTGLTTISEGTLVAGTEDNEGDSILAGNVAVSGGVLSGGGTIDGNVTYSSSAGTLAPGNSIGTLTISGNLTLSADDTTKIEFNKTKADKIVVGGNTTLAGTISLYPEDVQYDEIQFTIVDASSGGNFTGTFGTETMNNESYLNSSSWDISYDTVNKKVFLDLGGSDTCNIECTTTEDKFKDIAKVFDSATSGTFKEVGDILDSADTSSVNTELKKIEGTVLATTSMQPTQNHSYFNRALNNITSSSNSSLVSNFTSSTNELTLASLQDQGLYGDQKKYSEYYDYTDQSILGFVKNNKNKSIFEEFSSEDSASFLRTYGTKSKRKNIGSSYTGYESETTGILFGQQFKSSDEVFNGYSYGFTGTDIDYNDGLGESKIYSTHSSIFKQLNNENYDLNLVAGAFASKTESERNVSIFGTNVNDKYLSDYLDIGINQEVQLVKKFNFENITVAPSAKLSSTYVFKDNIEETGGDLALQIDSQNLFILKPEIGISLGTDLSKKENSINELNLAFFASQDHFQGGKTSAARFVSGSSFNVQLPRDYETNFSMGLGYNYLNKETNTSLMANVFMLDNNEDDMSSNIFSFTFRKLFGDFGKGKIPPVITKKIEKTKEKVAKVIYPDILKEENSIKNNIKKNKKEDKDIVKVIIPQPTSRVGESFTNKVRRKLALTFLNNSTSTLAYKDFYENFDCKFLDYNHNFYRSLNHLSKYDIENVLEKCEINNDNQIMLIANRLYDIDQNNMTIFDRWRRKLLALSIYTPFITFIAFIILFYEALRKFALNILNRKKNI